MTDPSYLEHYEALLRIRHRAARRDATITRWVFIVSMLGFFASGLLGQLEGLALYVATPLLVAFGAAYLVAWSKLDTTTSLLELVEALRNRDL